MAGRTWRLAAIGILLGAAACAPRRPPSPRASGTLELRFLDVGQGDAALVRNAGKAVLVDAGPTDAIAGRLRVLGVDSLDLAVATHNHSDHIGGMDAVLAAIPVRFYLDNGDPANTRIQRTVLQLVRDRGVTYLQATARTFEVGDARIRVIPSPVRENPADQNDHSVALLIERGAFKALLTGDSEHRELEALLREGGIPDVDVFKAPHHGSRTGVLDGWLARVRPEVVVISVAAHNDYGHPHAEALAAYQAAARTVLRTDRDGDVIVTVDAAGCYEVRTAHGGPAPAARGGPAACAPPPPKESLP
jgi:beta-lactamase superfamily II metal-dependent hydrolase